MRTTHPTLVILAAGIGQRYGGLKQIDPVGPNGEILIEYSLYDALKAGFARVVFVIRGEIEAAFCQHVGRRFDGQFPYDLAYQELEDVPAPFAVPLGRTKPWGTGHATLLAEEVIGEPFAVINADDFYGTDAYRLMSRHLQRAGEDSPDDYAMVGYRLRDTLSEHGHVARGICEIDDQGLLLRVIERTQILKRKDLVELDWSVEEAVQTIMSGGILRPDFLTIVPEGQQHGDAPQAKLAGSPSPPGDAS